MKKPQLSILLVGPILFGCGKAEQKLPPKQSAPAVKVSAENQLTLFPFEVGNSWNYLIEISTQADGKPKQSVSGEVQYKVTKAVKQPSGSVLATVGVFQDGKLQDEQEWSANSKGIFQNSMKAAKVQFNPAQPVIRFPVKDQDEFKWEGAGITPIGKPGTMKYSFKNDGVQENVDTEMGSMSALFMQSAGIFKTSDGLVGNLVVNSWFTPGVGLIRFRQVVQLKGMNSAITLRLKSYNVKK